MRLQFLRPCAGLTLLLVVASAACGGGRAGLSPGAGSSSPAPARASGSLSFDVAEATIDQLQQAMALGQITSARLVDHYFSRIAAYDRAGPKLNAIISLNPDARADAEALDRERAAGRVRGPLHGIPIIVKDNYDVAGLPTTGASLALAGLIATADAFQVQKLRAAGAVILGKSNLHELASGITTISSLGGQTLNPYDLTRNPGGSSGGTGAAIAAGYATIGWGSDTCGSIRIPAANNNLFGLRPTKGLSSVRGILPLSHTQDVAGPLARTVRDLAIALDATIGPDPGDPATAILNGRPLPRFVESLDVGALRGARIGVLASYFGSASADTVSGKVVRAAIERMRALGAEVVPFEMPRLDSLNRGAAVIDLEFKFDLIDYLAGFDNPPVDSLGDILAKGTLHEALISSMVRRNGAASRDSDAYRTALARRQTLRDSLTAALALQRLDAIAYPTLQRPPARVGDSQPGSTCTLSANSGLPAISIPAGFTSDGLPVGLELLGASLGDARLVALAYAYEQAVHPRRAPPTVPPLDPAAGRAMFRTTVPPPAAGRAGGVGTGSLAQAERLTVSARASGPVVSYLGANPTPDAIERATPRVDAVFDVDRMNGIVRYDVSVNGVFPGDLYAVVVRRAAGTGANALPAVIQRLAGPAESSASGTWTPSPANFAELMSGGFYIEVFTRMEPFGGVRARISP
jgi:amidase